MEYIKKTADKWNKISYGIMFGGFLLLLAAMVGEYLYGKPYDAGGMYRFLTEIFPDKVTEAAFFLIPMLVLSFFLVCLMLLADVWLSKVEGEKLQKRLICLFYGLLCLFACDDSRWGLGYELLHGFLSIKGIGIILCSTIAMLFTGIFWQKKCLWGNLLSCFFYFVSVVWWNGEIITGALKAVCGLLYLGAVLGVTCIHFKLAGLQRIELCAGVLAVTLLCGETFMIQNNVSPLSGRREQLECLNRIFAEMEQRSSAENNKIIGLNRGLELLLTFDRDAEVLYDPARLQTGKRSRFTYAEEIRDLYEIAGTGEFGLGRLNDYAAANGIRFMIVTDNDDMMPAMTEYAGYELLYTTDGIQLYYK